MKSFSEMYFELLEMYEMARDGAIDEMNRADADLYIANALMEYAEALHKLCDHVAERIRLNEKSRRNNGTPVERAQAVPD